MIRTLKAYHTWNGQTRVRVIEQTEPTKTETQTALRQAFGRHARVWTDMLDIDGNPCVTIGFDLYPGRQVVATGQTTAEALRRTYDWLAEFSGKCEPSGNTDRIVSSLLAAGVWDDIANGRGTTTLSDFVARTTNSDDAAASGNGGDSQPPGQVNEPDRDIADEHSRDPEKQD
jgi:hypothetical protein